MNRKTAARHLGCTSTHIESRAIDLGVPIPANPYGDWPDSEIWAALDRDEAESRISAESVSSLYDSIEEAFRDQCLEGKPFTIEVDPDARNVYLKQD